MSSALIDALKGSGLKLRALVLDPAKSTDLVANGISPWLAGVLVEYGEALGSDFTTQTRQLPEYASVATAAD